MFGGFGGVPKGSGKGKNPKVGPVSEPSKIRSKLEGGPTKGVPETTIRIKPGVTGFKGGHVGEVSARVEPIIAGRGQELQGTPYITRVGRRAVYHFWNSRDEFDRAKSEGRVGVRWVGPIHDESGYGEACRNYIAALASTGFPVTSRAISFGEPAADHGLPGRRAMSTLNLGHSTAINLVYAPPCNFGDHKDPNAYNIGMFVWEMNGLPGEWVSACNQMDEIWVPCEWNAKVCRQSGVRVPVHVFGHTVAIEEYENINPLYIPNIDPSWYKFYSIFQWSPRKNPYGLIKSYLMAFTSNDPVILILKTYGQNYSKQEEQKVKTEIDGIRREVGGSQPKILLITRLLSKVQVLGLHKLGDCFYLPHRAEGWGLPHFEACMSGKPVITTNYGGNLEFTKPDHSYLVGSKQIPVRGMEWFKWFTPDMTWADADGTSTIKMLRHVYENKADAARKGLLAKDFVTKSFNWTAIGSAIKRRLEEIVKAL